MDSQPHRKNNCNMMCYIRKYKSLEISKKLAYYTDAITLYNLSNLNMNTCIIHMFL